MASPPTVSPAVAKAYEHCRLVTKEQARNFYFAFLSLPSRHRPAVYAIYAFCRACDDYADEERPEKDKVALLEEYRQGLAACFAGDPQGPVFVALHDAIQHYPLSRGLFDEIITGVQMDLTFRRYATFDDLYKYCYRVASTVGLISLEVFGYKGEGARQHAIEMGIAMQLVNILRDVKEDAARDRIYIPLEDLARFGYPEKGLASGMINEDFRQLMRFEAARASEYFQRSAPLFPMIARDCRACPAILAALYSRLLDRIEARDWNVFGSRIRLSASEKIWLATKTWAALAMTRPGTARPRTGGVRLS